MKNMNKVFAGLMAAGLLLTTGCASTSSNSSSSTSDWYTGPGYDKLYEEFRKPIYLKTYKDIYKK